MFPSEHYITIIISLNDQIAYINNNIIYNDQMYIEYIHCKYVVLVYITISYIIEIFTKHIQIYLAHSN